MIVLGTPKALNEHEAWKKFIYYTSYYGGYIETTYPQTLTGRQLMIENDPIIRNMANLQIYEDEENEMEECYYKD